MKKHNILFALSGFDSDKKALLIKELEDNEINVENTYFAHTKTGVTDQLDKNTDIDTCIISMYLSSNDSYIPEELSRLAERYDNVTFIPILATKKMMKESHDYLPKLVAGGVLTALFQEDATFVNIAKIIRFGVKRKDAKLYYGVEEKDTYLVSEEPVKISPEPAAEPEAKPEAPSKQPEKKPQEQKTERKGFAKSFADSIEAIGMLLKRKPKEASDSDSTKGAGNLKKYVKNIKICFAGLGYKSGSTSQTLALAAYLSGEYKVACLEAGNRNRCFGKIAKYYGVPVENDSFSVNGIDFFITGSIDGLNEKMNELEDGREYNFFLIDFGNFNNAGAELAKKCYGTVITAGSAPWELTNFDDFVGTHSSFFDNKHLILLRDVSEDELEIIRNDYPHVNAQPAPEVHTLSPMKAPGVYETFLKEFITPSVSNPKRNEIKKSYELLSTTQVFVTSFAKGLGATHVACGIAKVLSDTKDAQIAYCARTLPLPLKKERNIDFVGIETEADEFAAQYDAIVYDVGVISELEERMLCELKRANYKVVMCTYEPEYMKELMSFLEKIRPQSRNWFFVFNAADEKNAGKIHHVMRSFNYVILPSGMSTDPKDPVYKKIHELLY